MLPGVGRKPTERGVQIGNRFSDLRFHFVFNFNLYLWLLFLTLLIFYPYLILHLKIH